MNLTKQVAVIVADSPLAVNARDGFAPRLNNFLAAISADYEIYLVKVISTLFDHPDSNASNYFELNKSEKIALSNIPIERVTITTFESPKIKNRTLAKISEILFSRSAFFSRDINTDAIQEINSKKPNIAIFFSFRVSHEFARIRAKRYVFVVDEWPFLGIQAAQAYYESSLSLRGVWRHIQKLSIERKSIKLLKTIGRKGQITAINHREFNFFSKLIKKEKIKLIPHGVDTKHFSPNLISSITEKDIDISIIGALSDERNYLGALKFFEEISKKKIPNLKFAFVGRHPPLSIKNLASESVLVTGTVDDIRPYYLRSKITIVPSSYKTPGTKSSILIAWAMQCPVVTNEFGASELPCINNENIIISKSFEDMAHSAAILLKDPVMQTKLSAAGYSLVKDELEYDEISNLFREMCNPNKHISPA